MALVVLLLVFLLVIVALIGFVFPPTKWLAWFYNENQGVGNTRKDQTKDRP